MKGRYTILFLLVLAGLGVLGWFFSQPKMLPCDAECVEHFKQGAR